MSAAIGSGMTPHAETLVEVVDGRIVTSDARKLLDTRFAPRSVTLIDGRVVDSWSEDFRHECEARDILDLPTADARRERLAWISKRRGIAAANALRATLRALHAKAKGAQA